MSEYERMVLGILVVGIGVFLVVYALTRKNPKFQPGCAMSLGLFLLVAGAVALALVLPPTPTPFVR